MKLETTTTPITEVETDAVIVGLYANAELEGAAASADRASDGALSELVKSGEVCDSVGQVSLLLAPRGLRTRVLAVVGLGERGKLTAAEVFQALGAASRKLSEKLRASVAVFLPEGWDARLQETAVCAVIVGCQGQDLYRAEKKRNPFEELLWSGVDDDALRAGRILGEGVNLTRRLVNEPPDRIYPESFAEEAQRMAATQGLECEVWDAARLEAERCGCLLAVAQGSSRPPRLVMLRHQGGETSAPTLALVGKGVTFDSGGLSIKPSDGMKTMKCDMAGAATVLGAMQVIAQLQLPINVLGLVGLVENMLSGNSYKLGDVLTSRNGKTVEVHNTDAEGRLVLADVLDVAVERKVAKIVDLATLTGACVVALGSDVAGLMTNNQAWCDAVRAAADRCGERVWQLPMFKLYAEQIRSDVADIKNVGDARWGGAITAAKFLEEFVGETPWTHMDIAGPSFAERPKSWTEAGATGVMVRTLVELARAWPRQQDA